MDRHGIDVIPGFICHYKVFFLKPITVSGMIGGSKTSHHGPRNNVGCCLLGQTIKIRERPKDFGTKLVVERLQVAEINCPDMVISLSIIERAMGNRGTKSYFN